MENPQENIIQDTTNSEKAEKGFGVEISEAPDFESLKNTLSTLNKLIVHDTPITSDDLVKINFNLDQVQINFDGKIMTVEEVERIPDLKENVKIWKEIMDGEFKNVKYLTFITDEVALLLSKYQGSLRLFGLETLSEKAAEYLGKYNGHLDLSSIMNLSDGAIAGLSNHKGVLKLDDLRTLSDKAAESLSHHQGEIKLIGLYDISEIAAEHLSKLKHGLIVKNNILAKVSKYK